MAGGISTVRGNGRPHQVTVDGFWMETHQVVQHAQFEAFADATGYLTVAERPLDPADFRRSGGEPATGSMVFTRTAGPVNLRHINLWWTWTPGAFWRHPEGHGSSISGRGSPSRPCRL